jgi:5-methyltetrahydrofolate--homocysteine methyltransferase
VAGLDDIKKAVFEGNEEDVEDLVNKQLQKGADPDEILNNGLVAGMDMVADKFKRGEYYLPDVLMSAETMKRGVKILEPVLKKSEQSEKKTVLLGTVLDDIHDIGKNIVKIMLEGAGFKVVDLGVDVSRDKFIKAVRDYEAQILGLSSLLSTSMPRMPEIIEGLKEAGLREKVRIIIGGAPVTERFAEEIGADGFAPDAAQAVDVVRKLT